LAETLKVPHVAVAADAVTAFLGTIGSRSGTVAICGTGVAVIGFDGRDRWRRVDARGYLLGDFGSGFWIGQKGLQAALDAYEGRGAATTLARSAERLGTPADIYAGSMASGGAPSYLAAFARDVLDAASAGDAIAGQIVVEAARQIARSISAARLGDGTVGLTGGLARSAHFVEAVSTALVEVGITGAPLVLPDAALAGAHALADRPEEALAAFAGLVVLEEQR
jgi:N-acetylglucosamine kinase-like BadF-type ATPase